jgi:hypothetical protein
MNHKTMTRRISPWFVALLLSCARLRAAAAVEDQVAAESTPPAKAGVKADPSIKSKSNIAGPPSLLIYKLKHADSLSAVELLRNILEPGDRIIPDPRTNALMVVGLPETQRKVADVLKELDMPPAAKDEQSVKIFNLVHADSVAAAKALTAIGPKGLRVSIDERTRSIIAAGSLDALEVAGALLSRLDEQLETAVTRYEVRVIWLASGMTGEGRGEPLTDDLKDVSTELSRLGIKDPRQVGQMVVQTSSGGTLRGIFEVKSSPRFGDQAADFNASGSLALRADVLPGLVMQIRLHTTRESPRTEQTLNEINTQIVLPLKQYVVLATAPTGNLTSVFVVQVTEVTKAPEKKGSR